MNMNRYQKAASVSAKNNRNKSMESYYKNPILCKSCGLVILVNEKQKVSEVKKKIFCSKSCSVSFNNKLRRKEKTKNEKREKYSYFNGMTKKMFFESKGIYYKFRAEFRKDAHWIYEKNQGCKHCKIC